MVSCRPLIAGVVSLLAVVAMAHRTALAAPPAAAPVESFAVRPPEIEKSHATDKIAAREVELTAGHLKLKAGARLYRIMGLKLDPREVAILGQSQAELALYKNHDWGWFFQAIDSPEKAVELVELPLAGAVIVKTAQQYQAILGAARQQRGFQEADHVLCADPPSLGLSVAAQDDGSYRVRMLIGICYDKDNLSYVGHYDCIVSREGRIICKSTRATPDGMRASS